MMMPGIQVLIGRTEREIETLQKRLDENLMQSEERRRREVSEQMGHQEKAASLCYQLRLCVNDWLFYNVKKRFPKLPL